MKKKDTGRGKLRFKLEFIALFHCLTQQQRQMITFLLLQTAVLSEVLAHTLTWVLTFSGSSV